MQLFILNTDQKPTKQTPGAFSITSTSAREGLITNEFGQPASPISLTPILLDSQIQRLSDAAESLVKSLPPLDIKLANNNKKRISRELEVCLFSNSLYFYDLTSKLSTSKFSNKRFRERVRMNVAANFRLLYKKLESERFSNFMASRLNAHFRQMLHENDRKRNQTKE